MGTLGPLVYLCSTPAPYRNAEVDRVADRIGRESLVVLFEQSVHGTASWSPSFPERCSYRCVDVPESEGGVPLDKIPAMMTSWNVPMVIVGPYRSPAGRRMLDWCVRSDRKYCLRSDSNIWGDRDSGLLVRTGRRILLSRRVRRAHLCLVTGSYNREFWRRHGMRDHQEGWWPQWIDYEHFRQARQLRETSRESLRSEFDIEPEINLLYIGRLIPRKNVDVLCEALMLLPERVGLVIAGHGESEPILRESFGPRLGRRLRFVGSIEPENAPRLYAATDGLVLASGSSEPWAMVLNEACAAGMPILCSPRVGAAGDLLVDGENGVAVSGDTVDEWVRAIAKFIDAANSIDDMARRSAEIGDAWMARSLPEECVASLLAVSREG